MGYSVHLQNGENLVLGVCSFQDSGKSPFYDWVAFERNENDPQKWVVLRVKNAGRRAKKDEVKFSLSVDWFTDQGWLLDPTADMLPSDMPGTILQTFSPFGPERNPRPSHPAKLRVVISGDVITFSIELATNDFDSYRLAGEYESLYFEPPGSEARGAMSERLQYGAIKFRSASCPSEKALHRAAMYGTDVLRRRGESLINPDMARKERLGDNNHLVLFVRNPRTGETTWLGVASAGQQGLCVLQNLFRKQNVQPQVLDYPIIPAPGLASPMIPKGEPAWSYPLLVGGEAGSQLVEVWLVKNQRTDGRFANTPTPLFDVQYLFLPPQ